MEDPHPPEFYLDDAPFGFQNLISNDQIGEHKFRTGV